MVRSLTVSLNKRSYKILVAENILHQAGDLIAQVVENSKLLLVSNPTVYSLYGNQVNQSLVAAGFEVAAALMPDGEEYKNMDEAMKILDAAASFRLERSSTVVALGGGVVGDLAGFVASIYERGIGFIQIPTTLLAQVDSSVGGKVAVNHTQGKNLIGTFHQPRLVLIDPVTLDSLSDRDFYSGMGEVVKYAIIFAPEFFDFLEANANKIRQREKTLIKEMIYRCCQIKSDIVAQDEREMGLRAILNLGHTFGHSLEKTCGYGLYQHGEAVIMGTMAAAFLAWDYQFLTRPELNRIMNLFKQLGIFKPFPLIDPQTIYQGMLSDKKVLEGKIRFIVPRGIGSFAIIEDPDKTRTINAIQQAQQLS